MLTEVLQYLKNWFIKSKYYGVFTIENGNIVNFDNGHDFVGSPILDGQYFRILGSALNDGVWQYPAVELQDEKFDGAIYALAIPPALIKLVEEIEDWQTKYGEAAASPYTSESFGGYSYSKSAGGGATGGGASWKDQFAYRLSAWRKI